MLDTQIFKTVVENAPLVSIDICLVCDHQILLGKRNNEPLKGQWFTPGGRLLKNESWQDCLRRVARSEMGILVDDLGEFKLMGIWDHFYPNSAVDKNISTHYVNLPHFANISVKPSIKVDSQHDDMQWFDLKTVADKQCFHEYMQSYASWLIKRDINHD